MDFNYYYQAYTSWINYYFETFRLIDAIIFALCALCVFYLLIFVVSAKVKSRTPYPTTKVKATFLVILPVYGDNELALDSIDSVIRQNYESDKRLVIVVANNCSAEFVAKMRSRGAIVTFKDEDCDEHLYSKDYNEVLFYCELNNLKADIITIIRCGDAFDPDNFTKINDAHYCGCDAIQIGRYFRDLSTVPAVLESVGVEINNTIFRTGHTALGFSSAVTSSGLSLSYGVFCEVIKEISDPHPEKQIETALLRRNIYIEFLDYVYMCRLQKIDSSTYYNNKKVGNSAHSRNFSRTFFSLPKYLFERKLDYCNKIVQWMLPSRIVLTVMMTFFMFLSVLANWTLGIKWLVLIFFLSFIYYISIPNHLVNGRLWRSIFLAPFYMVKTLLKMSFSRR